MARPLVPSEFRVFGIAVNSYATSGSKGYRITI